METKRRKLECLFCRISIKPTDEVDIKTSKTREGLSPLEGFIKSSVLNVSMEIELSCNFLCSSCFRSICVLEGYLIKSKHIQDALIKLYYANGDAVFDPEGIKVANGSRQSQDTEDATHRAKRQCTKKNKTNSSLRSAKAYLTNINKYKKKRICDICGMQFTTYKKYYTHRKTHIDEDDGDELHIKEEVDVTEQVIVDPFDGGDDEDNNDLMSDHDSNFELGGPIHIKEEEPDIVVVSEDEPHRPTEEITIQNLLYPSSRTPSATNLEVDPILIKEEEPDIVVIPEDDQPSQPQPPPPPVQREEINLHNLLYPSTPATTDVNQIYLSSAPYGLLYVRGPQPVNAMNFEPVISTEQSINHTTTATNGILLNALTVAPTPTTSQSTAPTAPTFVCTGTTPQTGKSSSSEKAFQCDKCDKKFSSSRAYKVHRRVHDKR